MELQQIHGIYQTQGASYYGHTVLALTPGKGVCMITYIISITLDCFGQSCVEWSPCSNYGVFRFLIVLSSSLYEEALKCF